MSFACPFAHWRMTMSETTVPEAAESLAPQTPSSALPNQGPETIILGAPPTPEDVSVRPFEFHASSEALEDLRRRISATRWPDRETVADDSQGVQLATMQKLAHYW